MPNHKDLQDLLADLEAREKQERLRIVEQDRDKLDERQARIMDYFWNREHQRQRRSLPLSVIFFLERDRHPPGGEAVIDRQSEEAVASLMAKDFIRADTQGELELDTHGVRWLLHQHPPVVRWWQNLLERVPPIAQLVVTGIGLLGSIYGVIELVLWIAGSRSPH